MILRAGGFLANCNGKKMWSCIMRTSSANRGMFFRLYRFLFYLFLISYQQVNERGFDALQLAPGETKRLEMAAFSPHLPTSNRRQEESKKLTSKSRGSDAREQGRKSYLHNSCHP